METVIPGRIGYDLYSEEPHVPLPRVSRFTRYLGGSSANMAVGLSRLGVSVLIVSCLGEDSLSRFLTDYLAAEKVGTSRAQAAPGYLPPLCLTEGAVAGRNVLYPGSGDPLAVAEAAGGIIHEAWTIDRAVKHLDDNQDRAQQALFPFA